MPSAFLDTNILVYAATGARHEAEKAARALDIIDSVDFGVSTQVLQEFHVAVTRPDIALGDEDVNSWIASLLEFECQSVDADIVITAISLSRRFGISFWDGAIVAAAQRMGCHTLYTETLPDGQAYGPVTTVNPFIEP